MKVFITVLFALVSGPALASADETCVITAREVAGPTESVARYSVWQGPRPALETQDLEQAIELRNVLVSAEACHLPPDEKVPTCFISAYEGRFTLWQDSEPAQMSKDIMTIARLRESLIQAKICK